MSLTDLPLRDPVASLTHLLTAVFGLFVTTVLWRLARGDRGKRISLGCFGACVVLLYTASGVYHAIPLPRESRIVEVFRRLDHSAIYLLIAGTYTPVLAVLHRGRKRVWFLIGVWSLAAIGITMKWWLPVTGGWLVVSLYIAMGWFGVVPMMQLLSVIGWRGLFWILGGGLAYTIGAGFEIAHWPVLIPGIVGPHEVFHVCDMIGTLLHVVFMIQCVVPHQWPLAAAPLRKAA